MSKKDVWSYDWSWTQPYVSMNEFFQGKECKDIYHALSVEDEIDAMEKIDDKLSQMTSYPDAEAAIKKAMQR